ncbi:MAG: PASTA domain-containing protein [Actinomycetota bacterium]|nr:PASTA domain-containing protein [Actinomycetota bacterium]
MKRVLVGVVLAALAVGLWFGLSSIAGRPKPPRFVRVPDLLGMQGERQIRTTLGNAGLQLGVLRETVRNTAPAGTVTGQEPDAGTVVPYLSSVDVVISAGEAAGLPGSQGT